MKKKIFILFLAHILKSIRENLNIYSMRVLFALLLLIPFMGVNAQKDVTLKEAQKFYKNAKYALALEKFQAVAKEDSTNSNIHYKIGYCILQSKKNLSDAIAHFELASQSVNTKDYDVESIKERKAPTDVYLELAKAYHINYQLDEAVLMYEKYKSFLAKEDEEIPTIDQYIDNCATAKLLIANPVELIVSNLGSKINGPYRDAAPVLSADEKTLLFTSRRMGSTKKLGSKDTVEEDGNLFEDIYSSTKDATGSWTAPKNITTINTPFHEATIGLSVDGQQVLITSDRDPKGNGDIYISKLNGETWGAAERLPEPINSESWEPDACFNVDGTILYFASDREGGHGGLDIYMVKKLPNGEWSYPQNLGPKVNTTGDDRAPFMHPDGVTLFFASNGHATMGGLDIFQIVQNEDETWGDAENIGYPINTTGDDAFYVTSPDGKRSYYSSYREEGFGDADIYMISLPTPPEKQLTVFSGTLTLEGDGPSAIVPNGAQIIVTDNETHEIVGIYKPNSKTGKYLFILQPGRNYNITYEAEGVLFKSENLIVPEGSQFSTINNDIKLPSIKAGENIILNNIFFEFDKDILTAESKVELEKLTRLLLNNPAMKVELQGHTDSKGDDKYNQKLSQMRADAVVKHLVSKGVSQYQLTGKGYGESQPIAKNTNDDGSDNPEGRKLNRRTVLKILSVEGNNKMVNDIYVPEDLKLKEKPKNQKKKGK